MEIKRTNEYFDMFNKVLKIMTSSNIEVRIFVQD